jgi:gas vesicle protein
MPGRVLYLKYKNIEILQMVFFSMLIDFLGKGVKIMREDNTNIKSSILRTVLAGSAFGAGVAFLLAPKPGSETRTDLKRLANRVSHTVDIGKDLYDEGKEFVGRAVEASRKAYSEEKPLEHINTGTGSFIVPILASGIIGASIALLMAPKAGSEIRDDLMRFATSTRGKVASTIDKGKDLYDESKDAITGAVEAGKKAYTEIREKVAHAA